MNIKSKYHSKGYYEQIRKELNDYLTSLLRNYPIHIKDEDVISFNKLSIKYRVSKPFIIDHVKKFLNSNYEKNVIKRIKEDIWPKGSIENKNKREKFFRFLPKYLEKYPMDILKIPSLQEFADMIKVERNTVTSWVKKYFFNKFEPETAEIMFREIWTNRQGGKAVRLKYEKLEQLVTNRHGVLITSRKEFNSMKFPSHQHIEIKCENNHLFFPQILHLVYHNQWCPSCHEFFCQRVTRLYMESIFKAKFPETSLKLAYGLPAERGGQLKWDGYNGNIRVKEKVLRIAFEYDGLQHDQWPNWFHKKMEDFKKQQINDRLKNEIAANPNFKTIVIRLKEKFSFKRNTIGKFQKEIINQFFLQTGINIPYKEGLIYNPYTNSIDCFGRIDGYLQ